MSQEPVDLLLYNIGQLCTIPAQDGGPQRGDTLGTLGVIENGAVAVRSGKIIAVGPTNSLHESYSCSEALDVGGRVIVPGFVDPHTHAVWVGDRAHEFEMRVAGAAYMEILAAGGGINSTVQNVRAASLEAIIDESRPRLDRMLEAGTTTVEIKTGYGLDVANELKLLEAIYRLDEGHPIDIVATFLGAHAIPPEYKSRTDDYVTLVVDEMIPAVAAFASEWKRPPPFIDVFCEEGVFDVLQTRRILEAGQAAGMPLKVHADEFAGLGGTQLAVELGAVSADHLVETPAEDIHALGRGSTIAVGLPGTPFGLGEKDYTPAHKILEVGGALALATDCNPGTAWCESMPFIMALACRYMRITPAQALAAATLNAAFAVGRGEVVGSVEVGKQADLVIVDALDYRHLAYRFGVNLIWGVVKAGRLVVNNGGG
jgi:imidazolonepropionase